MHLLVLGIALAISAPATDDSGEPAKPAAAEAKAPKQKKICRTEHGSSTSRMSRRICRTVTEWEEAEKGKIDASDLQRLGTN